MPIWYMSFAGDEGWRGVCLIPAAIFEFALTYSHVAGINPGGDVVFFPLPDDVIPPDGWLRRLISDKEELKELDRVMGGDGEIMKMDI